MTNPTQRFFDRQPRLEPWPSDEMRTVGNQSRHPGLREWGRDRPLACPQTASELESLRVSIQRGRPLAKKTGCCAWRDGLGWNLRCDRADDREDRDEKFPTPFFRSNRKVMRQFALTVTRHVRHVEQLDSLATDQDDQWFEKIRGTIL